MSEAILTRNRVSSWFTLHWGDVLLLANSHVHIHEPRAQQSLCVKEEARRHDSLTVTSSEKYRCPEDPSAQMCVWKHRTALDSLNLLLFPQRWLERVKRWTGDALRVHLLKHLRIEFSRSPTRCWGECSFNRTTARQYWAGNHYASRSRNALFPFTNFVWCSGGRCALDWVHRLLLITSQISCRVQFTIFKMRDWVCLFSGRIGAYWCNASISCVPEISAFSPSCQNDLCMTGNMKRLLLLFCIDWSKNCLIRL